MASAQGIRAGRAFVELFADDSKLVRGLRRAEKKLKAFGDVERWIGRPIRVLRSQRFTDIFDVFRRMRFLKGRGGAPCTKWLKRQVRKDYQQPSDLHVFGFTADEPGRITQLEDDNPSLRLAWLLQDEGITKAACFGMLAAAGIELPAMYLNGYRNNNCRCCVKGGCGYWQKVRVDSPQLYQEMGSLERELGYALLKVNGEPCFLDELPDGVGNYESEEPISCGPDCRAELLEGAR